MKDKIYCKTTDKGIHSFYLSTSKGDYFLFQQNYRKGVNDYFEKGVTLNEAMNFSRSRQDNAIMRTMSKLPMYIKYVEKEYRVEVLDKTKQKYKSYDRNYGTYCA